MNTNRAGDRQLWFNTARNNAHNAVFETVSSIQTRQSLIYDRFVKLEVLYDPNSPLAEGSGSPTAVLSENVIASNVDTVTAVVAATDVRPRFMTEDADWSVQRQAKHLEWYSEGIGALLDVLPKCQTAFKGGAKKGLGLVRVDVDRKRKKPVVQPVMVDDIMVDDRQTRGGAAPREIHQIERAVDKVDLKAQFPDKAKEIDAATVAMPRARDSTRAMFQQSEQHCVAIRSYRVSVGEPGEPGYQPGRVTYTISTTTLFDEEWTKPYPPYSRMAWSEREGSFYGISLGERLAGHQRTLNRRNWQIERMLDQNAAVTTYVRPPDANIAVQTTGPLGTIAVCKSDYPMTVTPPAVHPDILASHDRTKQSAGEEAGVAQTVRNGTKPAGLDSGRALREFKDQTTQRFAMQEKAYERFVLDTFLLLIGVCKDLGKDAPVVMRRTRFGARKIRWADVDMKDVKVQIAAASTLSRTPAGRTQTVLEWAQAGVVSMDEARRLMEHPDLERSMSLYNAALEGVEHALEEIQDGNIVMPEPFDNFKMCVWRGQAQYLICRENKAPERILEGLRQFVVQAAWMLAQAAQPANANMAAGAGMGAPAAPALPDPNAPMPIGAAPVDPAAMAAFAPQAMQLQAS